MSNSTIRLSASLAILLASLAYAGCGGSGGATTYTVGGTVTGLDGTLVIANNGGDSLTINGDGAFTFATELEDGAAYAVTITTQPTGQSCVVSGGTGTIVAGNIVSITIDCATDEYTVGGNVVGLTGTGLTLSLNGGTPFPITGLGTFSFPTTLPYGATFTVAIETDASDQDCTLAGETGTVGAANVTTVLVNCTDHPSIGGTVTGLLGTGLVLQWNGANDAPISGDGTFSFPTPIPPGTMYTVTVESDPTMRWQTCVVTNDTGTATTADITNIMVDCTTNQYAISGVVRGLVGTGLELALGIETIGVAPAPAPGSDVPFAFTGTVASGATYDVVIDTYPGSPVQACTVTAGSGVVAGGDVTDVVVDCGPGYLVRPTVLGLTGTGLVLTNSGSDDLAVAADGVVTFARPLAPGETYEVEIATQPTGDSCAVAGGSGTVVAGDVTSVVVLCGGTTYALGGTVTGLRGAGLVLDDDNGNTIAVPGNGSFAFPVAYPDMASFDVTVSANPTMPWQTCTVTAGGSGTIAAADFLGIEVTCVTNTYAVSGAVTGLEGDGLEVVLMWNDAGTPREEVADLDDPDLTFPTLIESGTRLTFGIRTQPTSPWQTCTIDGGTSTTRDVADQPITDLAVACTTNSYTIGFAITGVTSPFDFQQSGTDDINVTADGTYTFATPVQSGNAYLIQLTTPAGQYCDTDPLSGVVQGSNVLVSIMCGTIRSVGGTITGLSGAVQLTLNGGETLTVADTDPQTFTFTTPMIVGLPYDVTAVSPAGQRCTVTNGAGTMPDADVTNVLVDCIDVYPIAVDVSGLAGASTGVTLRENTSGQEIVVRASGTVDFAPQPEGFAYDFIVVAHPTMPWQTCTTPGTGTVGTAPVSLSSTCTTNTYSVNIQATLGGATGLVLTNNGGDALPIVEGLNTFAINVASGATFDVAFAANPTPLSACTLMDASGTIADVDATVTVVCQPTPYNVGGAVNGLGVDGLTLRVRRNAVTMEIVVVGATDASWGSIAGYLDGDGYDVSVVTQPPTRFCTVLSPNGTLTGASVTNADIECVDEIPVSGLVYGDATGVVIQNVGVGVATIDGTVGGTPFSLGVPPNMPYAFTVVVPAGRFCHVGGGAGTATTPITVTIDCGMRYAVMQSVAIPDSPSGTCGSASGAEAGIDIPVADAITAAQVRIDFNASHTWMGDVQVFLRHPDGTNASIIQRPHSSDTTAAAGFGGDLTGGVFSFANWHTANLAAANVAVNGGSFYPMATRTGGMESDLAASFGSKPAQGTWRLRALDWCADDLGSVSNPVLTIYQFAN